MKDMFFIRNLLILFIILTFSGNVVHGSISPGEEENPDPVTGVPVFLSPAEASAYLDSLVKKDNLWRDKDDTLKLYLRRIVDHYKKPFDTVRTGLTGYPFQLIEIFPAQIIHHDTLPLRWLDQRQFFVDTVPLEKDPFITQKTLVFRALDAEFIPFRADTLYPQMDLIIDSLLQVRDTITEMRIDYAFLEAKNIRIHRLQRDSILPPVLAPDSRKSVRFMADSTHIVISDTTHVLMGAEDSPFYIVSHESMPDSIQSAVSALLSYTWERDSILIYFHDTQGRKTPFWLTADEDPLYRYWVKNAENDSISLWIGNPSKYNISMALEEDVFIERLRIQTVEDLPIVSVSPDISLARMRPLDEIPVYWDHGISTSLTFNQNYLSNWARGGESSLSGLFNLSARATYHDKASAVKWTNNARLRYGTTRTKEHGARTTTDIIEINSQYNKKIWDNIDFSSVVYMKSQVAKGYNFPNDSVPVSKFLNPGAITLGAGLEFEPFKDTKLNFSALSYRNTFVLDTTNINQTTHGIEPGKRARQELGGQLLVKNSFSIFNGLTVDNSVRLFSNYVRKPQNVDIDWELSLEQEINWYFTVRFNFHLIYDDDVRFPVLDDQGEPVTLPDGSIKQSAKAQINQFLGITVALRF
ncbi:MAG: DUF3078 domain-containing protein [Bacteroidia bacterium]|nr:MAG: DUF3078 domain-containing protein [Bacteroidia bacterium]